MNTIPLAFVNQWASLFTSYTISKFNLNTCIHNVMIFVPPTWNVRVELFETKLVSYVAAESLNFRPIRSDLEPGHDCISMRNFRWRGWAIAP